MHHRRRQVIMKQNVNLQIKKVYNLEPLDYLDDWLDSPLLDGGGFLEAVGVDTAEQILTQVHVVKCRNNLQKTN